MGLVLRTYKSWELILQVLHQLVQDETCHPQHHLTTHQCRWEVFFAPEIASANCCKPFVDGTLCDPRWIFTSFLSVSKQSPSRFTLPPRLIENGKWHPSWKKERSHSSFWEKKTSILSTLPPMILFLGPQGRDWRKRKLGSWPLSFIPLIFVSNFQVLPMSRFQRVFFWTSSSSSMSVRMWRPPEASQLIGSVCWSVFLLLRPEKNESMRWKPLKNEVDTLGWW